MGSQRNIAYRPGQRLFGAFSSTISQVPPAAPFVVSIGGRVYSTDLSFEPYRRQAYRHTSEPNQRESLNFDNIAGLGTVNTSGLWRRDQNDWLFGAGQQVLDLRDDTSQKGAAANRYFKSKGINPWTQWQASLHYGTFQTYALINNAGLNDNFIRHKVTGSYKYYMEHDALYWEDITKSVTPTATGLAAQPTISIAALGDITDGMFVSDISGVGAIPPGTTLLSHTGTGPYTLTLSNNLLVALTGQQLKFVNQVTDLPTPGSAAAYYVNMDANGQFVFLAAGTAGIYYVPTGQTTGALKYATAADINGGPATTITGTAGASTVTVAAADGIQVGMNLFDTAHPAYISINTTVTDISGTTVTLDSPILHNMTTDAAIFSFLGQSALINSVGGYKTVFWGADNLWATAGQYILNWGGSSNQQGSGNIPTWINLEPCDVPSTWQWDSWTTGNSQIYLGGYNLVNGQITDGKVYRLGEQIQQTLNGSVTTTSTSYYAPVVALTLTPGEYPTALHPYLNYVLVGTNLGMRLCRTLSLYDPDATATGDLEGGPILPNILQPVTQPVTGFTANGRYLYFAWTNYDSISTGIGRCDVTDFIDPLAPAYASDLMVNGQGTVRLDWDPQYNAPLIAVTGTSTAGVYSRSLQLVASGTIDTGWLTFDIPDDKTMLWFHPQFSNDAGSVDCFVAPNSANFAFTNIGSQSASDGSMGQEFPINPSIRSDKFRVRLQLNRDLTDNTQGPVLTRWTMRGLPNVSSETGIFCVIDLKQLVSVNDHTFRYDPYYEYYTLEMWRREQKVVQFVEGRLTWDVTVDSIDWIPEEEQDWANVQSHGFDAVVVVGLKTAGPPNYTAPLPIPGPNGP